MTVLSKLLMIMSLISSVECECAQEMMGLSEHTRLVHTALAVIPCSSYDL